MAYGLGHERRELNLTVENPKHFTPNFHAKILFAFVLAVASSQSTGDNLRIAGLLSKGAFMPSSLVVVRMFPSLFNFACCFFALLMPLSLGSLHGQENNQPPEGFVALFNGKDLSGWHGMGHFSPIKLSKMSPDERDSMRDKNAADVEAHWSVRDGLLVNDGKGVFLTTDEEFGDIEMWVDYRAQPMGDSGVYLRTSPQVQIWDYTEDGGKWNLGANKGSGGLWNNNPGNPGKDPVVLADKPFGQWNRFRIRQIGARTSVWLNGKQVVDHAIMDNFWDREKPLRRTGHIQLQTHGGAIDWRNVFVREIDANDAAKILGTYDDDGFETVFNGKDFEGWAGPTDNYEIVGGVLRCKPNNGGTIYTEKEYTDFVARLEFRLPAGGNNGLAIRYPGTGDTAYTGMCELQVLDTEHPKYKSIDPRQAHGVCVRDGGCRAWLPSQAWRVEFSRSYRAWLNDQSRVKWVGDSRRGPC